MSTEQNKAIARSWIEGINQRNLAVWGEISAADCVVHDPPPNDIGLEEYQAGVSGGWLTAFPDWQLTIDDEIAEGDKVVQRCTGSGSHQGEFMGRSPTGKRVTCTGIAIYRIADGKIAEAWVNVDYLPVLEQLGVVHPLGEGEE
jgi:predicted ester cyclase